MALPDDRTTGSDPRNETRLTSVPRFSLKTLLVLMAVASLLFALMAWVGAVGSVLIVWGLILATAHVAANAWGTRAHAVAPGPRREKRGHRPAAAPQTPLGGQFRIGKAMIAFTALGALAGGAAGGTVLGLHYWQQAGWAAVALGGFSAAVLGGFAGFLLSSFVQVSANAWSEASGGRRRR